MKDLYIIWVAPKYKSTCPYKREEVEFGDRHTEGEAGTETEMGESIHRPGAPAATRAGGGRKEAPWSLWRNLILDFWLPEL